MKKLLALLFVLSSSIFAQEYPDAVAMVESDHQEIQFSNETVKILRFYQNVENDNFVKINLCEIQTGELFEGGRCESLAGGKYINYQNLRPYLKAIELNSLQKRKQMDFMLFVASIPLGGMAFQSGKMLLTQVATKALPAMAAKKIVKTSISGIVFAGAVGAEILITDQIMSQYKGHIQRLNENMECADDCDYLMRPIISLPENLNMNALVRQLRYYFNDNYEFDVKFEPNGQCTACVDLKFFKRTEFQRYEYDTRNTSNRE